MSESDPIKHAARWRPRPVTVLCVRSNGSSERYAVGAGRRAWTALRRLLPSDTIELVGLTADEVIVGRWQAPAAAAQLAQLELDQAAVDDDDTPSPEASMFRWLVREMRGIYSDQAKAYRDALAVVTDALKVQRETFASLPRGGDEPPAEDDGYTKVSGLLASAMQMMAMQRASSPSSPSSSSSVTPPRDSGDSS